ncbi:hypothetical protein ACJX0J_019167 [Zea mays]
MILIIKLIWSMPTDGGSDPAQIHYNAYNCRCHTLEVKNLGIHLFESTKIYPNFEDQICSIELFMTYILQTLHIHIINDLTTMATKILALLALLALFLLNPLAVATPLIYLDIFLNYPNLLNVTYIHILYHYRHQCEVLIIMP